MRVRFFEVDDRSFGFVLRCDQFPATLAVDPDSGHLSSDAPGEPACRLEDIGGQLLFEAASTQAGPLVNDAPLAAGPLLPGDRLEIDGRRYVVSYERTAREPPPEPRYRLADV